MYAHIPLSSVGATNYERVMGHAPHVPEPWSALEKAFFERAILPKELLEQVRRTLALGHGCEYCQAKAGPPDDHHEALRTSLAVALSAGSSVFSRPRAEHVARVLDGTGAAS